MSRGVLGALLAALALSATGEAWAAGRCGDVAERPWCDTARDPDARAELLLAALTSQERVGLLSGDGTDGGGRDRTHTGTSSGVPGRGAGRRAPGAGPPQRGTAACAHRPAVAALQPGDGPDQRSQSGRKNAAPEPRAARLPGTLRRIVRAAGPGDPDPRR